MKRMKEARGIRNNNPLNIRHSADRWEGVQSDMAATTPRRK